MNLIESYAFRISNLEREKVDMERKILSLKKNLISSIGEEDLISFIGENLCMSIMAICLVEESKEQGFGSYIYPYLFEGQGGYSYRINLIDIRNLFIQLDRDIQEKHLASIVLIERIFCSFISTPKRLFEDSFSVKTPYGEDIPLVNDGEMASVMHDYEEIWEYEMLYYLKNEYRDFYEKLKEVFLKNANTIISNSINGDFKGLFKIAEACAKEGNVKEYLDKEKESVAKKIEECLATHSNDEKTRKYSSKPLLSDIELDF